MKMISAVLCTLIYSLSPATADECRRVTSPTVIAVLAHGDVWVRKADRGMTFRARECKTNIGGSLYCRVYPYRKPEVYLKHADKSGREYTAFWGKDCQ
jgi:hypothetical protein